MGDVVVLTREQFLSKAAPRYPVELPELGDGCVVMVRGLNGAELKIFWEAVEAKSIGLGWTMPAFTSACGFAPDDNDGLESLGDPKPWLARPMTITDKINKAVLKASGMEVQENEDPKSQATQESEHSTPSA